LLTLVLGGCSSYLSLIDGLNKRQVQSCLEYNGATNLGSGFFSGSGGLHGVTATGGASLEMCTELMR
jgi:hypothetical protein